MWISGRGNPAMTGRWFQSRHRLPILLVTLAYGASPLAAAAQPPPQADPALRQEIDQLRKDFEALKAQYESRLVVLEAKLASQPVEQAAATPAPPLPVPALPDQPGALATGQTPAAASNVFNPSTSVIGNFLGAAGRNTVNPQPALQMPESEVSFQAVVDPYARADFFMSFGEEGVDLEEGFITFPTLPGGVLMRVGKMRSAFGKVNTLHTHVLPWTDRPLVTENLLGGEEGITDAGISIARLIPNPWTFLEATGQVFRGDSGDVFESSSRGDLSFVGHLRGYQDITESSNIDLGFSYAHGYNASDLEDDVLAGSRGTSLFGIDATYRWKPLQRAIYTSFLGRGELVWSRRDQPNGLQKAFGMYVSGDYQFARRWFAGARYDWSGLASEASLHDAGGSLLLTYKPSEFSLVRGQYRRTKFAFGETANELLFQFLFAIGAHGAHPF
jgi:hypothetical protein